MTDFNDLVADTAHVFFDCVGGEPANIRRVSDKDIPGVAVLVDRDIDVVSDNGLSVSKRTVISFNKAELLSGSDQVKLCEGDLVEMLAKQSDGSFKATGEEFKLWHPVSEDVSMVQWYVR